LTTLDGLQPAFALSPCHRTPQVLPAGPSLATRAIGGSGLSLTAEDIALGYKNLVKAERGPWDMKTGLHLRPVYHHLEHRIRAHELLCWLALLLTRVAEQSTQLTWRRISTELD
jgi:transposase